MSEFNSDNLYKILKEKNNKLLNRISELKKELDKVKEDRDHAEFRIRTELDPRIEQEKKNYDIWVSQITGERECQHFESLVDEICDFVNKEQKEFFEWDDAEGDFYQMILFLIKNRNDINIFKIEEKS